MCDKIVAIKELLATFTAVTFIPQMTPLDDCTDRLRCALRGDVLVVFFGTQSAVMNFRLSADDNRVTRDGP